MAFKAVDISIAFQGQEAEEIAIDAATGKTVMRINPRFYRPAEVDLLVGDATKARDVLGWTPTTPLEDLCSMMVEADIRRNQQGVSF
jgi:GDPmannose 4,6-dehydratase